MNKAPDTFLMWANLDFELPLLPASKYGMEKYIANHSSTFIKPTSNHIFDAINSNVFECSIFAVENVPTDQKLIERTGYAK